MLLTLGIAFLGFPVFAGVFGARIDLGKAFLLALVVDTALAAVYVGGIRIARRSPDGSLRAIPPAIACAVLAPLAIIGGNLVFAVAAR
ncbi:MAG: hypothetical protein ABIR17_07255 [Pseudolysinimonas sp.]|uniref:hypothetical protein n=1 Tax=Pseudolysinimonas sp. TaxID=2680009 RepID=UPI00326529F9